jgi:hypothetical protein
MEDANQTFSAPTARSRTLGTFTGTGPIPVITSRSARYPWRMRRDRPSSVLSSAWAASRVDSSASTACSIKRRAPERNISVNGSGENPDGSGSGVMVIFVMWHIPFSPEN